MNVIIATEFLEEKDWVVTHIEETLSLFPKASLVSLTYTRGALGSTIESRLIVSTQNKKDNIEDKPWMMSLMVGNIVIPEDTDLVISFSRGYIQNLKLPSHCKHFCYYVDKPLIEMKGFKKWLSEFTHKRQNSRIDMSACLSESLAKYFKLQTNHILQPFFKLGGHEFDPLSDGERNIDVVINISAKTNVELSKVAESLKGVKFLFHGSDKVLSHKIDDSSIRSENCYQKGCHGTQQKLFEHTKVFIDLSNETFNPLCLQAMSAGCFLHIPEDYQSMIPSDFARYYCASNPDFKFEEGFIPQSFNPVQSRRYALKFNGRIFKRQLTKKLDDLVKTQI